MENCFVHYIEGETFHLKYAKGAPSLRGREFHDYHEIIWFLGGSSHMISKNIQRDLAPGELILVPRASFHQFTVLGSDYTRLILGFRESAEIAELVGAAMNEVKIIEGSETPLFEILERLRAAIASDLSEDEKRLYIRASLIHILLHLKSASDGAISKSISMTETVISALNYIDGHYTEEISVEGIAEALHVSASLLFHRFKKELNISVYQYVAKKRLSNARLLIESGKSLCYAALHSGFKDYSAFYRMYQKYYGEPPSKLRTRSDFMKTTY